MTYVMFYLPFDYNLLELVVLVLIIITASKDPKVMNEIGKSGVNNRNEVIYELPWMVLTNPYRLKMFHTFEPNRFPLV